MNPSSSSGHEVLITGLGPLSAIGCGVDAFWSSIRSGATDVGWRDLPVDIAGHVKVPLASMPADDNAPGLSKYTSFLAEQEAEGCRDLAYSLLATELALSDAGLAGAADLDRVGLVQVFEAPGVERTVSRLFGMMQTPPPPGVAPQVYDALAPAFYAMQPFLYTFLGCKCFGFRGFCTSVHNACSSGAFALEIAAQRIRTGRADLMVVAGGEAFDTAVRLEWFRRLDLYAKQPRMSPFAETPTGFYVGEGAAALVLESAASAEKRGANPYARYSGGGFANQAWKQTIPDLRARRMRVVIDQALTEAGRRSSDVDLIVPHGACTSISDGYEAKCVAEALGTTSANGIAGVAFKPQVGHLLATNGLIESIAALLAMKHQTVPPTPGSSAEARFPADFVSSAQGLTISTIVKLFTGFTGHDAAVVYERPT